MYDAIDVKQFDRIAIITFTRPLYRNAISSAVLGELNEALDTLAAKDLTKLIFTGRDDVFASGANLREISNIDATKASEFAEKGQRLMRKIADFNGETIAAINGFCFGGALDLALACDRRIASPMAVFCHPGSSLGIVTGWGGTQRLPRLIGEARALEFFLTADRYDAQWALEIGLIDAISDDAVAAARLK